jgi:NAD+ diphosphatase
MTPTRPSYVPLLHPPEKLDGPALWFAFRDGHLAILQGGDEGKGECMLPVCGELSEIGLVSETRHYLGLYDNQHCFVAELAPDASLPPSVEMQGLRTLFGSLDESLAVLAGRAYQIKEWDRNHRFCGRCGGPTVQRSDERARVCRACRRTTYPPISPAIMVLILRGREMLLLRRKGADATRFSALAGFVEPGEELEDTVRRETREEVNVAVDGLKYFGSQPWPFPHSLMVAFTAHYAGGEVQPDGVEIEEARWFDAAELLQRPYTLSIGWRLINTVAGKLARGEPL